MKNSTKIQLILVVVVLVGCASNIKTKKTIAGNFNEFQTFAYLPNTTFDINAFNSDADNSVEAALVASMNNEMIKKGYSINNEDPDLLLLLRTNRELNSNENTKSKYEQASSGGSTGSSPNYSSTGTSGGKRYLSNDESTTNNIPYKRGSLAVEMYDTKTKELVWVGVAENVKTHISDQTLMERMLKEIFKKFPE
ncbi:MAG: DUF4136 domain-containing protein [Bacteroidota bacterium]